MAVRFVPAQYVPDNLTFCPESVFGAIGMLRARIENFVQIGIELLNALDQHVDPDSPDFRSLFDGQAGSPEDAELAGDEEDTGNAEDEELTPNVRYGAVHGPGCAISDAPEEDGL